MMADDMILGVPIRIIAIYEGLQHERFQSLGHKEMAKEYYERMRVIETDHPNVKDALKEYNKQWDEFLSSTLFPGLK